MYKSSISPSIFTIPPLRGEVRWGLLLFALALTACRTTQKTAEQTDSLAVRVSVQDSTRRDIQFRFDELDMWMVSVCDSMERVAQPKPYVAHLKFTNGDYKRQEEQKTEVLNDVTDEHTKSTQKILKPPKIPMASCCWVVMILGIIIGCTLKLYRRISSGRQQH